MTDPSLVRVLAVQTPRVVGLVDHLVVKAGAARIAEEFAACAQGACITPLSMP